MIKVAVFSKDGMRMLVRSKLRLNVVNGLTEFYDSRDDQLTEQALADPCHKTNAVPVSREDFRKLYQEVL